jgi:hypothetical protein
LQKAVEDRRNHPAACRKMLPERLEGRNGFLAADMSPPPIPPAMSADYYRRHAARVRRLADEATTPAIRRHLHDIANEYECLAERVDSEMQRDPL